MAWLLHLDMQAASRIGLEVTGMGGGGGHAEEGASVLGFNGETDSKTERPSVRKGGSAEGTFGADIDEGTSSLCRRRSEGGI